MTIPNLRPKAAGRLWLAVAIACGMALTVDVAAFMLASYHVIDQQQAWSQARDVCRMTGCDPATLGRSPRLAPAAWVTLAWHAVAELVVGVLAMTRIPRTTPKSFADRGEAAAGARPAKATAWTQAGLQNWLMHAGMLLVALGVVLRLGLPLVTQISSDGGSYAAMGHALQHSGSFTLPWGDVWTGPPMPPQASHHYPPLWPMVLAAGYTVLGFGVWQTQAISIATSILALAVVWACSRDLYGSTTAWLTTGLVAVAPRLVWTTGAGFSEPLTLLLFTATMWAILRSLEDSRWMVVAGAAAGLSYLTRSTMGPFFLIAGLGGLAWRFYFVRWRVLQDRWYLAGAALFAAMAGAWAARNLWLFHWPNWQGSGYNGVAQAYAFQHPGLLLEGLGLKAVLFLFFLLAYAAAFLPELRRAARHIKRQEESGLLLGAALVFGIGWALAAIYWVYEAYPAFWLDNERYAVIALVPILWLAFRHRETTPGFAKRYAACAILFMLGTAYVMADTGHFADATAAQQLAPQLHAGDSIGYEGKTAKYSFYAYLPEGVAVYRCLGNATSACGDLHPTWILSVAPARATPGYVEAFNVTVPHWGDAPAVAHAYRAV